MDSNVDPKSKFGKPSNDSGNRKYRHRSPLNGSSSSSGGSPDLERISSPTPSRKNVEEIDGDKRRREGRRDLDRDLSRSQCSCSGELYKHSDRQSSGNSHAYCTRDDYSKRDEHVDDYDRDYPKSSSRSGRNSRDYYEFDHSRRDYEHRSREYPRGVDKYSRDRSDNLGHRSRDKDKDLSSDRAGSGRRYASIEDCKFGERDRHREDRDGRDGSSKQVQEAYGKVPSEQAYVTDSDIDAAKIAAMKAAELVNKNLVGTGYMSTDQKKKLLWGNKKNTTTEELFFLYHWDATTFGDRERQEKFNKLMGVKGDAKVEQKQDNHNVEKQREQLQLDLEKHYTAGLRRRDGRTVGLGL